MPPSDTAATDAYLSSAQAARRLGMSKCTLLRAVHRGDVAPARQTPGGAFRFLPADLDTYAQGLSSRRRGGAGPIVRAGDTAAARNEELRLVDALPAYGADLRRAAEVAAAVVGEVDLPRVLDRIVRTASESACLAINSLLLLDDEGRTVRHAAAVGIPDDYIAAIDGLPIGPMAGTCGVAAWRGEVVVTEDLRTDPNWAPYHALVAPYGWRAVWSVPLCGAESRVLGTFAAYQDRPGRPTAQQLELLSLYAHLAAAAVERARAGEQQARLVAEVAARTEDVARSEARLQAIVEQMPSGVVAVDRRGHVLLMNEAGRRLAGTSEAALPAVPENAPLYNLRAAETGRPLTPADTPRGHAPRARPGGRAGGGSHAAAPPSRGVRGSLVPGLRCAAARRRHGAGHRGRRRVFGHDGRAPLAARPRGLRGAVARDHRQRAGRLVRLRPRWGLHVVARPRPRGAHARTGRDSRALGLRRLPRRARRAG